MKTEIEKELNALAQKAFESHNWDFQPFFPNVLVRLFDFESATTGLIIKPQTSQAPNYRGIVVRTWKPFIGEGPKGQKYEVKSELEAGDLITVPFYAGVPTGVEHLDDANYRVIPENVERIWPSGAHVKTAARQDIMHIFFKCGFYDKRAAAKDLIELVYHNIEFLPLDGEEDTPEGDIKITIESILDKFDIVPKQKSLTQG